MKIAFVGDSFCADANRDFDARVTRHRPTWPSWVELVARKYEADIICMGEAGMALFHSYENLIDIIDEADYIVLCITKEFRLANRYRIGITPATTSILDKPSRKLKKAATFYYKELMSTEFHSTVHYLLIKEIDKLLYKHNKKVIWFFVGYFQLIANLPATPYLAGESYKIKSGPVGDTTLSALSDFDLAEHFGTPIGFKGTLNEAFDKLGIKEQEVRLNHLTQHNNVRFAQMITDIIDNDDFTPKMIKMNNYFKEMGSAPQWVTT